MVYLSMSSKIFFSVLFVLFGFGVRAQSLNGTIADRKTRSALEQVHVLNVNTGEKTVTDAAGQFSLKASVNQVLVFYYPGYISDTLLLVDMKPVKRFLAPDPKLLKTVEIQSKTFNPEVEYADIYRKANPTKLEVNKPFAFYPSGYFSREGKFARKGKRKLEGEKIERKIDERWNEAGVKAVTPLNAGELDAFMAMYRPELKDLNKMDAEDLKFYIMNAYKEFKTLPADKRVISGLN